MPQLDDLIDHWAQSLATAEPRLARHLDEIRDHVRTDVQTRIDGGDDAANAFASAVGAFGAPRDVAMEFLRSTIPGRALILKYVGAYIVTALVLTAAVVIVDTYYPLNVMWVGLGLGSLMILPAAAIPFYLERSHHELVR